MKIDLSGQVAVVTGGSGDLGRVMCRTLAACGAAVAVHYHSRAAQADEAAVQHWATAIRAELGEPSIVIANAVQQYQPWT